MPPEPAGLGPTLGAELRLHPLSFLFKGLAKAIGIPLAGFTVLVLGGGDVEREVGRGIVVALLLAGHSLMKSQAFRYRLTDREIVIRDGLLARTERHVPYGRIQNVAQRRTLLHRLFGVTELRLESAGGARPEAVMAVITLEAAQRIESLLSGHQALSEVMVEVSPSGPAADARGADPEQLVTMSPVDLLRLGLATNRSWAAISGAIVLVASQARVESASARAILDRGARGLALWEDTIKTAIGESAGPLLSRLLALVVVLVLLKLLSVVMAFLTFHGFRLSRHDQRLSAEGGLLDRRASSVRIQRIQRLCVTETWIARLMGQRSLACAVDAGHDQADDRLSWLVPLAPRADVDRVLEQVAPGLALDRLPWLPLHRHVGRRRFLARLILALVIWWPAVHWLGLWGLGLPAAILLAGVVEARSWAGFAAYACDGKVLAFRTGWWRRQWRLAWLANGQSVALSRTVIDRRQGMATVHLDTAGSSEAAPALRIPFLPEREAGLLAAELRRQQ